MAVCHGYKVETEIRKAEVSLRTEEREIAQERGSPGEGPGTSCPRMGLL